MRLLLTISFLFLLTACKKDKVHSIEGNFLVENTTSSSYSSSNSSASFDIVLPLTIENDSLVFDGYKFPLSSFDPLTGEGNYSISLPNSGFATLTLSNGFNEIVYHTILQSSPSGPIWEKYITGERTEYAVTSQTENTFGEKAGNYNLYIQAFENYNALDTSYFSNASVSYNPATSTLVVNGTERALPLFHTHYNKTYNYGNTGPNERILQDIYWDNDSLYFHFHHTSGISYPPQDTTHYHYQGSKM